MTRVARVQLLGKVSTDLTSIPNRYERVLRHQDDPLQFSQSALEQGVIIANGAEINLNGSVDWLKDRGRGRSFLFHLNAWDPLDDAFIAFDTCKSTALLELIVRATSNWCRYFDTLDIAEKLRAADLTENLVWYDMAAAMRVYRLAYLIETLQKTEIELIADQPRINFIERYLESFFLHSRFLADERNFANNNHGMYVAFAQMAAGRRLERSLPGAKEMYDLGKTRFARLIELQFSEEGIHKEHSPFYHDAMCRLLKEVIDTSLLQDKDIEGKLHLALEARTWFITPDNQLANLGDTDSEPSVPDYAHLKPPYEVGKAYRKEFKQSGYWAVRHYGTEGESYLCLTSAFHSRVHKHADDCSFIWYERGRRILLDGGRYNYSGRIQQHTPLWYEGHYYSDPFRVHVERTRSHNTVEINDRNHPRWGVKKYGSGILRTGEALVQGSNDTVFFCKCSILSLRSASVRSARPRPGQPTWSPTRHWRIIAYLPNLWLLCVDVLRQYDIFSAKQWFNFDPRFDLARMSGTDAWLLDANTGDRLQITPLTDTVRIMELGRGSRYMSEDDYPGLLGWHSPKGNVIEPNLAFCFGSSKQRRKWSFATLLSLHSATVDRQYTRMGGSTGRFRWSIDDTEFTLSYTGDKSDVQISVESASRGAVASSTLLSNQGDEDGGTDSASTSKAT